MNFQDTRKPKKYVYNKKLPAASHGRSGTQAVSSVPKPIRSRNVHSKNHIPSNSVSVNATSEDIETQKADMREILWQNAELLDPVYRRRVWSHMAKAFHGRLQATIFDYDQYKNKQLPTRSKNSKVGARTSTLLSGNKNERKADDDMTSTADQSVLCHDDLDLLLDRYETYSMFVQSDQKMQRIDQVKADMKAVLNAHACANQNQFGVQGAVQLCAVILTTYSHSAHDKKSLRADTFVLLQILTQIMRDYYQNDGELMKNETLLLMDVLCVNEPKLVKKLNDLEIDVIDLSVFVSAWIGSLFANHFPIEFVQRVIDLVLLEGASVLITIVYGILQFIKGDIMQCENDIEAFDKIAGDELKSFLKSHEFINSHVMTKAQLLFTQDNYKYVITKRGKKSWQDLLGLPGKKFFNIRKGIGDEKTVKKQYKKWRNESRRHFELTARYPSSSEEEEDFNSERRINGISPAQIELKEAKQTILQLQKELSNQKKKHLQATSSDIITSMNTTVIHQNSIIEEDEQSGDKNYTGISVAPISKDANNVESKIHHTKEYTPTTAAGILAQTQSTAQRKKIDSVVNRSSGRSQHNSLKTLSDILYINGDQIFVEQPGDNLQIREIQFRTENMTESWKRSLEKLNDASITLRGWLYKLTSSRWNSKGGFDKVQRRWFVLRGSYFTYFKTDTHASPKSDKCMDVTGYICNPVLHKRCKYAFELISTPNVIRTKSQAGKKERTKMFFLPEIDSQQLSEEEQKTIRERWVKSLRLAAKGANLWDVFLDRNLVVGDDERIPGARSVSSNHSHHHSHYASDLGNLSHHQNRSQGHHSQRSKSTHNTPSGSGARINHSLIKIKKNMSNTNTPKSSGSYPHAPRSAPHV